MDSLKETQPNKWVWQVLPVGLKVCVLMINYQTEDGMPRFKVITIWSQQLEKYVHTFEDILPLIFFTDIPWNPTQLTFSKFLTKAWRVMKTPHSNRYLIKAVLFLYSQGIWQYTTHVGISILKYISKKWFRTVCHVLRIWFESGMDWVSG